MSDLIQALLGAAIGVTVVEVIRRRRYGHRLKVAPGDDLEGPVKLRSLQAGSALQARWRDGFLRRHGATLTFRPRRPRPGPTIDLTGSTMTGTRPSRLAERWWFAGGTVLQLDGPAGRYEVGTGGGSAAALAEAVIRGAETGDPAEGDRPGDPGDPGDPADPTLP